MKRELLFMNLRIIVVVAIALAPSAARSAISPEISYRRDGGKSPYEEVGVAIDANGRVNAFVKRRADKVKSYTTVLNETEAGQLNQLLRTAALFDLTSETIPPLTDTGKTTIVVKTASAQKEISYAYQPRLQPLEKFLWKCITQADLADDFEGGRMYELLGGISPNYASPKVLQPYLFKEPLAKSLIALTNYQQIAWRLEALSYITTTKEFAEMVEPRLNDTNAVSRILWLRTLYGNYRNLQKDHLVALFPVLAGQMQRFGDKPITVDTPEGAALYFLKEVMEENNYPPTNSLSGK